MKIVNMIKGSQRYNGQRSLSSECIDDKFKFVNSVSKLNLLHQPDSNRVLRSPKSEIDISFDSSKYVQPSFSVPAPKIKKEPDESDNKLTAHSIIGLSGKTKSSKLNSSCTAHLKRNSNWNNYHESLQRIDCTEVLYNHYQKHWFSTSLEVYLQKLKLEEKSRQERLEITRYELRRHLKQILKSNLGKSNFPVELMKNVGSEVVLTSSRQPMAAGYDRLVPTKNCEIKNCSYPALPCTHYCTMHIMHNSEQVLFAYCTAKFADNTQCSMPVFDITHELPLCPEHARKRDNYKMYQETKPKKVRRKVKPSAMIRPQKRSKKKKKPVKPPEISPTPSINVAEEATIDTAICDDSTELSHDMVEEVLDLNEADGLELVSVEQSLVSHATNLLEETDISTVLSTIPTEEFSDFFSINRNGEYEPTREETEELERALAAVDHDVKSLEKLSQSQGLLDSILDEHTLVESLVQIPDIFHNGYSVSCGESMVTQTSRLLPVEPHSHS